MPVAGHPARPELGEILRDGMKLNAKKITITKVTITDEMKLNAKKMRRGELNAKNNVPDEDPCGSTE